jgi:ATP-dependent DNA ligase
VVPVTTDPAEGIPLGLPGPGIGPDAPGGPRPRGVRPMWPTAGAAPFDDPAYLFEPWWPGIHAFVIVGGGAVRLEADALADPGPAFPELAEVAGLVRSDRAVLDATILVLDARARPSADLLRRRLAGQWRDGVGPRPGRAALVATDLLWLGDRSIARRPFGERRGELAALLRPSPWCLAGHGFVGEGIAVARALGELGFHWVSAHRLDAPYHAGPAGDAWFRIPIEEPAARRPPPFLAVARRLGL